MTPGSSPGAGSGLTLRFQPPGPVTARFIHSTAAERAIMGPVAGGKTSTCLIDMVFRAMAQRRSSIDGVRRTKFGVIRDTYRNLEKTTIPSWFQWIPKDRGEWTGGEGGRPAKHTVLLELPDGSRAEMIMEFYGLGENRVEDVMRGWEGTGAFLNEADRLDPDVLTFVRGRIMGGRYPSMAHGGPTRRGITLDFNAPDDDNYLYARYVGAKDAEGRDLDLAAEGIEFYRQPSGFSPQAENLHNLMPGFYERTAQGQPDWWVRRYVRNEFGYSREGKPVYPEFSDARHVARAPLVPAPGIPLVIGADAGLTPAAVTAQRMPNGQWRALDELVVPPGGSMGPLRFADQLNRLLAEPRYLAWIRSMERGKRAIAGWADPSAAYGADKEAGELAWIETFAHRSEIPFKAAPTQELTARIEAVRAPLSPARFVDADTPGLLISPTCRVLRKGFNSGYRFRKIQLAGTNRYGTKPEKNEWSHVHDALQYALSGGGELDEVTGRRERREQARRAQRMRAQEEYDPLRW